MYVILVRFSLRSFLLQTFVPHLVGVVCVATKEEGGLDDEDNASDHLVVTFPFCPLC